jgi:hypothetical protein
MNMQNNIFDIKNIPFFFFFFFFFFIIACSKKETTTPNFHILDAAQTGIDFSNDLTMSSQMNIFKYMYFYNGGGIGVGDFNKDGLIDAFFTGNQVQNRLYLNKGAMKFQDVTAQSGITHTPNSWSNGVAVVDINQDGLLDIYISQVANFLQLTGHNELWICKEINAQGVPIFEEKSNEYGLDLRGFGTQAAFFDYDVDGDLDMFQLNHSLHNAGTFGPRRNFLGTFDAVSGDRFFRNDNGIFKDITTTVGINSNKVGYGLGITVADVNNDGFPDVYVGNDFHENDYLYINQKNGTFKEQIEEQIGHTSRFSMGVDMADLNNDGNNDIMSLDMQPYDPLILKSSEGEDGFSTYNWKIGYGYNYQYARNALQLNNGNGTFSETGCYSGVYATDWSWATLFFDFDNDGKKDIFIGNGIPKRMNDIDYIKFATADNIQMKINQDKIDDEVLDVIRKVPEIKIYNKFYKNGNEMRFADVENAIQNNKKSYSNGAVYADFDNDGDLDVMTTNVNDKAFLYENILPKGEQQKMLSLSLKGSENNKNAIGSKLIIYKKDTIQTFEKMPTRGFQSSMETPLYATIGNVQNVDSMHLIWSDNTFQKLDKNTFNYQKINELSYIRGLPKFNFNSFATAKNTTIKPLVDITERVKLDLKHEENPCIDFDAEPLIPHAISTEGPALAVGDLNGDGLEDVFFGGGKWQRGTLYFQTANGTFTKVKSKNIEADSVYEDIDALIIDVDNDNDNDLIVGTGGNEFKLADEQQQSRVYLNDGKGNFMRLADAFAGVQAMVSSVTAQDFTGDGFVDLFVGSRAIPRDYGATPTSYLLQNDGKGHFKDVTAQWNKDLATIGLVKHSTWADLDGDKDLDLIVATEWDVIYGFFKENNTFRKEKLTNKKGWWNFTFPCDVDNDGDLDLVAGNLGENTRLQASDNQPVRLFFFDADDNGKKEQIVTHFVQNKEVPFMTLPDLQRQVPSLKKKYLFAKDFAKAELKAIFAKGKLEKAQQYEVNYFSNAILINDGKGKFTTNALPGMAQLSPYYTAQQIDANGDNLPDILLYGNFYNNSVQLGRYDADYGKVLINKGNGQFIPQNTTSITKGEVRRSAMIMLGKKKEKAVVLARNNDKPKVISLSQ